LSDAPGKPTAVEAEVLPLRDDSEAVERQGVRAAWTVLTHECNALGKPLTF